MNTLTQDQIRLIRQVLSRHRVPGAKVFGSMARGDATDSSDIDLLLEPTPGMSLVKLASLKEDLESMLGRKVDLAFARSLPERIAATVLNEARAL